MLAKLGLSLSALILLVGCASQPDDVETPTASPSATPSESQSSQPEAEESSGPKTCQEGVQVAIEGTINSQTAAFGADDYELAYSFSSPYFQATVTVEQFVQIINSSYGPLISSSNLVFSNCQTDQDEKLGVINVRFIQESNDVYGLQYLLVNTKDGWRVQAASRLGVVGEGA